jgi:hypothetical protein
MGSTHVALRMPDEGEDPFQVPGFWMKDDMLELWLRLLALHVEEPRDYDSDPDHGETETGRIARKIRDDWLYASRHYFPGCVPHSLEDATATEQGRTIVREAVISLNRALERTTSLSAETLNLLGFDDWFGEDEGSWRADVAAPRLRAVGQAFLDLLDGKIEGANHDCAFMPGTSD